jgi:hypothetical protein
MAVFDGGLEDMQGVFHAGQMFGFGNTRLARVEQIKRFRIVPRAPAF